MTFIIKRIPVWPIAKIVFVVSFILSLVGFLFYSMFLTSFLSGMMSAFTEGYEGFPALTSGAIIMAGLFMSVFSSILYTLVVMLVVLLYNGLSSLVGGVEMEVDKVEDFLSYPPRQMESDLAVQQDTIAPKMETNKPVDNEPPVQQG